MCYPFAAALGTCFYCEIEIYFGELAKEDSFMS